MKRKEKNPENENTPKKRSFASQMKQGCLEGLAELSIYALAFLFGCLLFIGIPREQFSEIPIEIVTVIGGIFGCIPICIVIAIIYLIKKKHGRKSLNRIYKSLKGKYDLNRVTLTRKMHGEYTDVYILRGKSERGKFELYRDGEELVFSPDSSESVRLASVDEAIAKIEEFMAAYTDSAVSRENVP